MNKSLYFLLIVFICWSCSDNSTKERHQSKRNNIVNVRKEVKEIDTEDVLIGRVARLYLINNYLFIKDPMSQDKLIHIFDKNNFQYITSIAELGQGPKEITNIGHIAKDEANSKFYVSDHGKQRIFSYELDSVLIDPSYSPKVKKIMKEGQFPGKYEYINDTLCIGKIIEPIGVNDFKESIARWNMNTNDVKLISLQHPKIKKKRIDFALSEKEGLFAECYHYYNLMTIYDLNGNLKCNIYGPNWNSNPSKRLSYYTNIAFCKNKILTTYSSGDEITENNHPTKFLIFDINGNYIKTLETGYKICNFCYDEDNNRIIMNLDDEKIQFAYLDIEGLI